jgi:hypothetical protein
MRQIKPATFVAINLAVLSGAAIVTLRPGMREVSLFAATVVATCAGAWLAFQFGAERIKRSERDNDLRAGNMLLVVLTEFLDGALQYQRNYIAPVRNNPDFWWIMRPDPELDLLDFKLDHAALSFLLTRDAAAWRAIVAEERRQKRLSRMVADRKRIFYEIVFPKFESAGLHRGQAVMGDEIERILGPEITATLKEDTGAIVEMIDDHIRGLENCIEAIRAALSALHPGSKSVARDDRLEPTPLPGQ